MQIGNLPRYVPVFLQQQISTSCALKNSIPQRFNPWNVLQDWVRAHSLMDVQ